MNVLALTGTRPQILTRQQSGRTQCRLGQAMRIGHGNRQQRQTLPRRFVRALRDGVSFAAHLRSLKWPAMDVNSGILCRVNSGV